MSASLQDSDIILTSGGASVGDYDLVKSAARELGIQMYFDKVNIRPGKPTFAGHINKTPLIGLPGNPVSSYICAQLFLIPLIMKIVGYKFEIPKISSACLEINLGPNGSRKHFMRGKLTYKNEKRLVSPKERQDSSLIKTLQDSNCLIMRPPNDKARFQNDLVEIITLQWIMTQNSWHNKRTIVEQN